MGQALPRSSLEARAPIQVGLRPVPPLRRGLAISPGKQHKTAVHPLVQHGLDPLWAQTHASRLTASYRHWTGMELIPSAPSIAPSALFETLYFAKPVIVSHGTESDPIFNFGNLSALQLFEMDWDAFTSLPSRRSAEPLQREERQRLLDAVSAHGFIDDYQGIRVSATGRRFHIAKAIVWNLRDENGHICGQAATFNDWTEIEAD